MLSAAGTIQNEVEKDARMGDMNQESGGGAKKRGLSRIFTPQYR